VPNPAEDLVACIRTNNVGCAFAMHIAKVPDREGLEPLIINSWADTGELGVLMRSLLEGEPKMAAAIFPNVATTGCESLRARNSRERSAPIGCRRLQPVLRRGQRRLDRDWISIRCLAYCKRRFSKRRREWVSQPLYLSRPANLSLLAKSGDGQLDHVVDCQVRRRIHP